MKPTFWKLVGVMTLTGATVLTGGHRAQATGSATVSDPSGLDYDAACTWQLNSGVANSYASPGGMGCGASSTYDGSSEGTDLRRVALSSDAAGRLIATFTVDGGVPGPGNPALSAYDLPASNFVGASYFALFQNTTKQVSQDNLSTGCYDNLGLRVEDKHRSWIDGYHFYVGYEVSWDGTKWVHRAFVGEYDPGLTGGYASMFLGENDGTGWVDLDPFMVYGTDYSASMSGTGPTTISVTVDGVVDQANTNCTSGYFATGYAEPGDGIENMKGISTADSATVLLPGGTVAGQTYVGRSRGVSDVTEGNSVPTQFNTNIPNISLTRGFYSYTNTAGPPIGCPLPPCEIDDETILLPRGSVLLEYWDTPYQFVF